MIAGLRLAAGFLTVLPVRPTAEVTRPVARSAMLLGWLAAAPVALVAALAGWGALLLGLPEVLAGAVVVGEDLGTVEPWVRDYLRDRGLFGTSILWFERTDEGAPLPAAYWREACLSAVTTHDLPPTAGYLAGEHIRLRESLGLLTRPVEEEIADDRVEQQAWLDELRRLDLVGEQPDIDEIVRGLHAFLGRTPSKLLALALPDAVGDLRAQNQPGTTDEYPNWRVPLSGPDGARMSLEDVFSDPRANALAEVMKAQVPAMDT